MCKHERRLAVTMRKALGHTHRITSVACALYNGSRILALSTNGASVHAERNATGIAKYPAGAVAYVARARKDGSRGLARPCPVCRGRLILAGVVRVYYTTYTGYAMEELPQPARRYPPLIQGEQYA